jgi:hypothetical protein
MLNSITNGLNKVFDGSIGRVPLLGKHLSVLTPKSQTGGIKKKSLKGGCNACNVGILSGGFKYTKRASLDRSRRMSKRIKDRTLRKKNSKGRKRGRTSGRTKGRTKGRTNGRTKGRKKGNQKRH